MGAAGYVAHSAAYLHRIGCKGFAFSLVAEVCKGYDRLGVAVSGFKRERAEIDPCAAAHCLVDREFLAPAGVIDCVSCILSRIGKGLVAYVHGIFPLFWYVGIPGGYRWFSGADGRCLPVRPVFKRVFGVAEVRKVVYEPVIVSSGPSSRPGLFLVIWLGIHFPVGIGVIVHNHFVDVRVAFFGKHDVCSGVLKHWDGIWQDISHCEEVFHCLEKERALPLPGTAFEVSSMARPKADDVAFHAFLRIHPRLACHDKWDVCAITFGQPVNLGDVVGHRMVSHRYSYGIRIERLRKVALYLPL